MKALTTIKQAVIFKVTIKATGKSFYAIKSDSSNEYYQLHMNADGNYKCNCKSHKPCKHERALNEILDIQVAELFSCEDEPEVAQPAPVAPVAPVAKKVRQVQKPVAAPALVATIADKGALNGNRGFSLMLR